MRFDVRNTFLVLLILGGLSFFQSLPNGFALANGHSMIIENYDHSEPFEMNNPQHVSPNQEMISSLVLNAADFSTQSNDDYIDAIVLFKDNIDIEIKNLDPKHWYKSLNGFSGKISHAMYSYLKNAWFVNSISKNSIVTLSQDMLDWGVDYIDAERVWGGYEDAKDVVLGNYAGQGIRIGIIDTGIEYTHPELQNRFNGLDDLGDNQDDDGNGYIDDYYGWNILDNNNNPMDTLGHGTMVAGVIAAEDNGIGVIGVAPQATLVAVKVANAANFNLNDGIAGIDYCIASKVDIISMSWAERENVATLEDACHRAYDAGIVLVGAVGNDNLEQVWWPAKYDTVISVGAVQQKDEKITRWTGSNYGIDLDLVAPGGSILTTDLTSYYGYITISGTSLACPMVSGVVALLLSANPNLTPAQIRTILISTATKLDDYEFDSNGFNIELGYGVVNASAAMDSITVIPLGFNEDGSGINSWIPTDHPYSKIETNINYDGKNNLFNYEYSSHYTYWQLAESSPINLINWDGLTDLRLEFQFRCQSNYAGSSVTQFRLFLFDVVTKTYVSYSNPTSYNYYLIFQQNRNGQTWINGKDSGWQSESFIIPASDLNQFVGTRRLVFRWGHIDSWDTNWYQREYLDYLKLSIDTYPDLTPYAPRNLLGLGDGESQITLSWQSSINVKATQYKIYKYISSNYVHIATIYHTGDINSFQFWTDSGLSKGVTYYYRVVAVNQQGVEGPYSQWSGTVMGFIT